MKSTITEDNGWLSPNGDFHVCPFHKHKEFAKKLEYSEDTLIALGWIKFSNMYGILAPHKFATQKQIDAIWDWCQKEHLELPEWLLTDN